MSESNAAKNDLANAYAGIDITIIPDVLDLLEKAEDTLAEVQGVNPVPIESSIMLFFYEEQSTRELVIWLSIADVYREMKDSFPMPEQRRSLFQRLLNHTFGIEDPLGKALQRRYKANGKIVFDICKKHGNTMWCYKKDGKPFVRL